MDTCICMAESLHCSHETITALLIIYTPIGNKKLKKKILQKKWFTLKNNKQDHHYDYNKNTFE